jgi:hypothetical protein
MHKTFLVGLLVVLCLALGAGPALAQKDPFHPVIDPNAVTTAPTGTTTTTTDTSTVFQSEVGSEGLATTGTDVTPWLALAYGLLVLGGGTVIATRLYQPQPTRR